MSRLQTDFFRYVAQTSDKPLAIEVASAKGCIIKDAEGKKYLDLIAGISVCNVGHRHPDVIRAIRRQLDKYLHVMVYGEMVESPQVQYAKELTDHLPSTLDMVYFTNSGAEAIEGAMKLAKRVTNRTQIIAFSQSYHGSTQGALSIMGDEYWRNSFRPLLPDVLHLTYNDPAVISQITEQTACVVAETIQAERGVAAPDRKWLQALQEQCNRKGALLVLDEIQVGFGRTGHLWGFEGFGIVPDILVLGKAIGGGLPLGAFISSRSNMLQLAADPVLGHITTFGGHPVSCAAGLAAFEVLLEGKYIERVPALEKLFRQKLKHPLIGQVRSAGLLIAVEFTDAATAKMVIDKCLENGLMTDWFLFAPHCLRIAPPLTITEKQIAKACKMLLRVLEGIQKNES
jgi:acetylornithine/succinyldiaminopimelate/putrescine aminotransferase